MSNLPRDTVPLPRDTVPLPRDTVPLPGDTVPLCIYSNICPSQSHELFKTLFSLLCGGGLCPCLTCVIGRWHWESNPGLGIRSTVFCANARFLHRDLSELLMVAHFW